MDKKNATIPPELVVPEEFYHNTIYYTVYIPL